MNKILFCFGTRPETIKMAPLILEAKKRGLDAKVCLTGQHREMLTPFVQFFNLQEDFHLDLMQKNQSLSHLTSLILNEMDRVLEEFTPDCLVVQGDTTSTFSCALAAFYKKIPIAHIEAGLRTYDLYSPYPEEGNRQMVSCLSHWNFCPTKQSQLQLQKEGRSMSFVVGNTSIDALRLTIEKFNQDKIDYLHSDHFKGIDFTLPLILVTSHRRENHGEPLVQICHALKKIAQNNNVQIVYPVHLNPHVQTIVEKSLAQTPNVHLIPPLDYAAFVWLMLKSTLILTDSGGVQEEAPFLKKPIFVLREKTERPEVVEAGGAKLVGHNKELIINEVQKCLTDQKYYDSFIIDKSPYGNGHSSKSIIETLQSGMK